VDAMMAATAVLLKNFISDLNIRLFKALRNFRFTACARVLLSISLWLFRGQAASPAIKAVITASPGDGMRNGVAIRACFGKPAFVSMQHMETISGNSYDLRPVQEKEPKPANRRAPVRVADVGGAYAVLLYRSRCSRHGDGPLRDAVD